MKINWQNEVELVKEELMNDLKELLAIDSVRDSEHRTAEYPLGPGPAFALQKILAFGVRDGFKTKNIDNLAGHIDYGPDDAEMFGILGHVDVVPTGQGWETEPFEPIIKDGKLFARGSSDDKGPSLAAYYAMKLIKKLNLPINKKIRFIFGTDEESEWLGIHRYKEVEELPKIGFSPDANFPIINGEKGIISCELSFASQKSKEGKLNLVSFTSGLRSNMVPSEALAVVKVIKQELIDILAHDFSRFLGENQLKGTFELVDDSATFTVIGKAVHAQDPKLGINAATYLGEFLNRYQFDTNGSNYLSVIAHYLHKDFNGRLLNIYWEDKVMGQVTSSANVFRYGTDEKIIIINIRHPKGITNEKILQEISESLQPCAISAKIVGDVKLPHYVSAEDPFIKTLLEVYEEHTGEKGKERTIGGGTYGRVLEKGCAFGALFPDRENVMHQPNEYMYVEDIYLATAIYADAIYRLVK